jgi:hypothetical protein
VYTAQQADTKEGDFCDLISKDLEYLKIHMNKKDISSIGTNQYKTFIKSKVQDAAFQFLLEEQQHHSKVKHIKYDKLKIQPYLCSPIFSRKEKSTLFRLRSRTITGIRSDFCDMYGNNKSCPVCPSDVHLDSIPALLSCLTLLAQGNSIETSNTQYEDIFSSDVNKQKEATVCFMKLLNVREKRAHAELP